MLHNCIRQVPASSGDPAASEPVVESEEVEGGGVEEAADVTTTKSEQRQESSEGQEGPPPPESSGATGEGATDPGVEENKVVAVPGIHKQTRCIGTGNTC